MGISARLCVQGLWPFLENPRLFFPLLLQDYHVVWTGRAAVQASLINTGLYKHV